MIYFPGYPADASTLLKETQTFTGVHVVAGDIFSHLAHCPAALCPPGEHITFSAFASYGEEACPGLPASNFFTAYAQQYNQTAFPVANAYNAGSATGDAILAYDATQTFIQAQSSISTPLTGLAMQKALSGVNFQGASGHIAFASDGSIVSKPVLIIFFDHAFQLKAYYVENADGTLVEHRCS